MSRVSIIGAGNVGATLAMRVLEAGLGDVVLLDIAEGICRGKAIDMTDAAVVIGHNGNITGTKNYKDIEGSDIVVITAGFPRTPGMSREELFLKNSSIVKEAVNNVKKLCPNSIIIIVTNPLDAMVYLAYKESGFARGKVFGMAGVLDTARFTALISQEARVKRTDIEAYVIGSHGDTMVPLVSQTKIKGRPIEEVLSKEKIEDIKARTKVRGAEIVSLLKSGSAYYAPSASAFAMVKAILRDEKKMLCVSCLLEGEYGLKDICIGVPVILGRKGIDKFIEMPLSDAERREFNRSVEAIRGMIGKV